MTSVWTKIIICIPVLGALAALPARAQNGTDWPMYGHDLASTRFSPLTQINAQNVAKLSLAWSYPMKPRGAGPAAAAFSQVTPIVVNGAMYMPAGNRVVALDPDSGKEIWVYQRPSGLVSARGVAYWPGDVKNPPRLFFTSGHQLVALNARTGQPDPGFGDAGEITMDVPFAEVPTIYKNVIVVGANVYGPGEANPHPQDEVPGAGGISGDSRAYDAVTGKKLWVFHTIAQPGEVGHNTWADDSWKGRWGSNVWSITVSVDEKHGIVYMPIGGPAANYYGG
ncbi:MAG TPA: PQQ-binding-like beta-propeller repeat protein, partial [Candidatus Acidoferrum sp.]|nr:PQQ-binding-like beta-propeller repeat protein [Candidatus Acidoferrum sp.]